MNKHTENILNVYDALVIARLPRKIWGIYSSLFIFWQYFTRLKAREIRRRNVTKLGKCWSYCTQNRTITNAYCLKCCILNNLIPKLWPSKVIIFGE